MNSPHFAQLVSEIPTHFALDDHEIGDNWSGMPPGVPKQNDLHAKFAIATAARFMSSGRDQRPILKRDFAKRFYYPLSHPEECDFPTFVADTRTERCFRQTNHADRYDLFNTVQCDALTRWLLHARAHDPDSPKFIISGSIIAPVQTSYCSEKSTWRQQDGWAGYPKTLESLLLFIVEHQISKVVFVGGDAHLSSVSTLELEHTATGRKAIVRQIVSSGLYAPMPFANAHAEDYNWSDAHTLPTQLPTHLAEKYLKIRCKNTLLSDHYYQFVRVDATEKQVTVTCMDENNKQLAQEILFM